MAFCENIVTRLEPSGKVDRPCGAPAEREALMRDAADGVFRHRTLCNECILESLALLRLKLVSLDHQRERAQSEMDYLLVARPIA